MPKDIFISHSWGLDELNRDNHKRCEELSNKLISSGYSVWFDSNEMIGNIDKSIIKGINKTKVVLLCLTLKYCNKINNAIYNNSPNDNCYKEWNYSIFKNKYLIPIIMEPIMKEIYLQGDGIIQMYLNNTMFIDFSDSFENNYNFLCTYLKKFNVLSKNQKYIKLKNISILSPNKKYFKTISENSDSNRSSPLFKKYLKKEDKGNNSNRTSPFLEKKDKENKDSNSLSQLELPNNDSNFSLSELELKYNEKLELENNEKLELPSNNSNSSLSELNTQINEIDINKPNIDTSSKLNSINKIKLLESDKNIKKNKILFKEKSIKNIRHIIRL